MGFAEAYDAALQHDAQYRSAGHERETARLAVPIARSALLPSIGLSVSGSDVSGTREFPNSLNQQVTTRVEYSSPQANLAVRMPIFNYEALRRVDQAKVQSEAAESVFRVRALDLIDRLGAGYLQVLLSFEGKALATSLVESLKQQLLQAERRAQQGEGTPVDVARTQANLDLARVREVEADDQIRLSLRQLRRITGLEAQPLRQVPDDYMPGPLQPHGLEDWLELAMRQNPSLKARELAVEAARMAVQRQYAGHLPRLDMVASVSHSQNESLSNLNQTSSLRSIGLQLSIPLYSGGGVDASVKQAVADQARVEEEVRVERENVSLEIQRQHQAVALGASRIVAYKVAVDSAALALQGSQRALEMGLSTNHDVAEAQARYSSARRELAQARVDYLISRLRLMVHAGMPMADVVADLDRALVPTVAAVRPAKETK